MQIPGLIFLLLIAIIIISWLVRLKRSLVAEIITFIGLAVSFVIYPNARQVVEFIIGVLIYLPSLVVDRLQNKSTAAPNFNFGSDTRIADFVVLVVLFLLSISLGSVYGLTAKLKRPILGFIVRVFNLLLMVGYLMFITGVSLPSVPLLDNMKINLPDIRIPEISVTGATGPNPLGSVIAWARWVVLGIAFFFLLLLFFSPPTKAPKPGQAGKPRTRFGLLLFVGVGLALAIAAVAYGGIRR